MIPEIGVMIGIYIVTRMLSFITRKEPINESILVKIAAGIAILVTVFIIFDLIIKSLSQPQVPRF